MMMSLETVVGGVCDRSDGTESPKNAKLVRNSIRRRTPAGMFIRAISCGVGILRHTSHAQTERLLAGHSHNTASWFQRVIFQFKYPVMRLSVSAVRGVG